MRLWPGVVTGVAKDSAPSVFSSEFDLDLEPFSLKQSEESLSFLLSADLDLDFDLDLWRSDDLDLLGLDMSEESPFSSDFVLDLSSDDWDRCLFDLVKVSILSTDLDLDL